MREIEFEQLWFKLDKEVQELQHEEEQNVKMQQKPAVERGHKDDQLCDQVGVLHLRDKFSNRPSRRAVQQRSSSSSCLDMWLEDHVACPWDKSSDIPGISDLALSLISNMEAPSRSQCLAALQEGKKSKPMTRFQSMRIQKNPRLDAKTAFYKSLQSPDFGYASTPKRSRSLANLKDHQKSKQHKELVRVSILSSKTALSW